MPAAFPTSGTGQDRQRKRFMERTNLKNRKAIFEICSLLFSFWRRSRRITPRIHVILNNAVQRTVIFRCAAPHTNPQHFDYKDFAPKGAGCSAAMFLYKIV
jgi:hypothetical protein